MREISNAILHFYTFLIFKQASACQPPTREICCIGPGIVDSVEQDLYIMFTYKYRYILKAWIFFSCAMLTQRFQEHRLARSFSGNSAPISATQGRKSSPDFRQNLSAGNRCPIWAARGGNRTCDLSVASLRASN